MHVSSGWLQGSWGRPHEEGRIGRCPTRDIGNSLSYKSLKFGWQQKLPEILIGKWMATERMAKKSNRRTPSGEQPTSVTISGSGFILGGKHVGLN